MKVILAKALRLPAILFGRAYGLERSADMVGAVVGPLVAAGLIMLGPTVRTVILISIVPSAISVAAIVFFTRDRKVSGLAPALCAKTSAR